MEVILTKDVEGVGKAGSVMKVKDGYARNFLLPRKIAIVSTPANKRQLELEEKRRQQLHQKLKSEAVSLKEKLEKLSLTLPVLVQEKEKLYGSITSLELAKALQEEGIEVDKGNILLEEPIKALGIYEVPVSLYNDVTTVLKVWVVKK